MNKEMVDSRFDQIIGFMSSRETSEPQEVLKYKRNQWVKSKKMLRTFMTLVKLIRTEKELNGSVAAI